MKKLMTMIAAVGMAFGLFADDGGVVGTPTSLEEGTLDALWSDTSVAAIKGYEAEGETPYAYDEAEGAKNTRFYQFSDQDNFLHVSSTFAAPLYRWNATEGTAAAVEDGTCFDTLVQLVGVEDDEAPALATDAKLAVWLKATLAEDVDAPETNLYVTAGFKGDETTKTYKISNFDDIEAGTWHRVTVKVVNGAFNSTIPGFAIYIDGVLAQAVGDYDFGSFTVTAGTSYYNKSALFPSATADATFVGVGFAGNGNVDDISVTWGDKVPAFTAPAVEATFVAETGLKSFQYKIGEGDVWTTVTVATDPLTFEIEDGQTLYFNPDGYVFDTTSKTTSYKFDEITPAGFQEVGDDPVGYQLNGKSDTPSLTIGVTATPYVVTVVDGEGEFHGYTTAAAAIAAIDADGFAGSIAILNEDGFNYRGVKGAIGFNQEDTITVDDQGVWFVTNADEIAVSSVAAGADIRVKDNVSVSGVIAGKLTIVEGECFVSADLEINNEDSKSAGDEGMLFALGGFSLEDEVLITLGEHGLLQTVNQQAYEGDESIFTKPEVGKKILETEVKPGDEVVGYQYTLVALGNFQVTVPDLATGLEFVAMTNGEEEVTEPVAGNYTVKEGDTFTVVYAPATGYEFTDDLEDGVRTATSAGTISAPTVAEIMVENVELDITSTNVVAGETFTLTATVTPDTALDKTIAWTTSDEDVATVVDGAVTAVAAGTATITATNAASGVFDTCTVTVSAKTPIFGGGDGSEATPFIMATADHFTELQEFVAEDETFAGKFFTLTGDVDMTSAGAWTAIGGNGSAEGAKFFSGTLDGAGFAIQNIKFNNTKTYNGFFGTLKNATIKNITFSVVGYDVEGAAAEYGAGVVAAYATGTTFDNVTTTGSFAPTHNGAGFAVKVCGGTTFTDCTNNVNIASTGVKRTAGFVDFGSSITGGFSFIRCVNNGNISVKYNNSEDYSCGGFVGSLDDNSVTFEDCVNNGTVVTTDKTEGYIRAGAFIGFIKNGSWDDKNLSVTATGCSMKVIDGLRAIGSNTSSGKRLITVSGLNYATIAGDPAVATFVDDDALALNGSYKVMAPNAAPEFEFTAAGTIAFDTNLCAVANFDGITGDESLNVTDDEEGGIVTFTAALKTFTVTFYNDTEVFATSNNIAWGTTTAAPVPAPTKDGAEFKFWATIVEDQTNQFDFAILIKQNYNLYAIFEKTEEPMIDPTQPSKPMGADEAADKAAEINANPEKYITVPQAFGEIGQEALAEYQTYFKAVVAPNGDGQFVVQLELNEKGSNTVATAEQTTDAAVLTTVLAATGATSMTVPDAAVIPGFYYSMKQGGAVTALGFAQDTDANKKGGAEALTFQLQKPETSGFYQMIVTPKPVVVPVKEEQQFIGPF